jgi:hypothetical protein
LFEGLTARVFITGIAERVFYVYVGFDAVGADEDMPDK